MKQTDLFKYFLNQKNVRVFSVVDEYVCRKDGILQLMEEFNCKDENIFSFHYPVIGDYLVTDDNIGLKPDFLILYPEGHMLFFTLIE